MEIFATLTLNQLALFFGVGLLGGFIKGAVGFGMPTILIVGLGSFLSPQVALAALILPAFITNLPQAFWQGPKVTRDALRAHWVFVVVSLAGLAISAQFVMALPERVFFLGLGCVVSAFAFVQLMGWQPQIGPNRKRVFEVFMAGTTGLFGGVSGMWAPTTVLYLTALNTPKDKAIAAQGVIYGFGALMLLVAHSQSGVLNDKTWPIAMAMLVPCFVGLGLGMWLSTRLDQARFRKLTLIVLVLAGVNLIRRGLF
ncbi:MAG: sulfite exporter TauE/SafE family protein [Pseudomonadota bacterium]